MKSKVELIFYQEITKAWHFCLTPAALNTGDLTHLPLVPHASVNRVGIGSDNGLSLFRRQAII